MDKNVLLLGNKNLFSCFVYAHLTETFDCTLLNVRYPNENLSKEDFFHHQLKEIEQERRCHDNLSIDPYDFVFNEHVFRRIGDAISFDQPSLIIYEMVNFNDSEWQLLKALKSDYDIPIIVYMKNEKIAHQKIYKLLQYNVREVIISIDKEKLQNIVSRNLKTR